MGVWRKLVVALAALGAALMIAACGSTGGDAEIAISEPAGDADGATSGSEASDTESSNNTEASNDAESAPDESQQTGETDATDEPAEAVDEPEPTATVAVQATVEPTATSTPEPAPWVSVSSRKFGGLTFDVPADFGFEENLLGNNIWLIAPTDAPSNTPGERSMIGLFRLAQMFNGQPVASIADAVEVIEVVGGGTVTEGDQQVEAFGLTLDQYHVKGVEMRPIFSNAPLGFPGEGWWAPTRFSDLYMGELDSTVVGIWVSGRGPQSLAALTETMHGVLDSMLMESESPPPLPEPAVGVEVDFGPDPELADAERLDNDSRVLDSTFSPPVARVQFLRFGLPIEFDLPEGVIVPLANRNMVAIGDPAGRGALELSFIGTPALAGLVPLGHGQVPIGQPIKLDDIDALMAEPPPNLTFTNVDADATIGGQPGAVFDIAVTDIEDCGDIDAPCMYAFMGPTRDYQLVLGGGHVHRVWLVHDLAEGGIVWMAAGRPDEVGPWLDTAQGIIDSMVITTVGDT